ncbi:uncharacterized protein DNG_05905 [Cephalotrichum gorgonifer]|uniref:Family c-likeg-protein-coupled receptor protein n=1 Tax=Cephalotrichum gorgonifer TaxID=2041049 RepID=A0AAE8SVZ0_9PEZI|nr:uncharacterized protein DNG_05905 [Cephalotrichum gorgonifer]
MASPAPPQTAGAPPMPTGNGPYLPRVAALGGRPTVGLDVPVCAVFLFLFLLGAVFNMTVFQINKRRGHKFILSGLLFGFCMARITTCVMRIVWATRPNNVSIGIASNVFNAAGVLILFMVNLIFAQRLVRAYHPKFGWHRGVGLAFRFLYFSVVALLIMVITVTVRSFFTLDPSILSICRKIQLFAGTYLALLAFLPIPIVLLAWAWPRAERPEKFGQGRFRTKVFLVLFTSAILAFGAGFRIGGSYAVRPLTAPGWFHHKAAFYVVNFALEIIVLYMYALMRFDKRFHIPDGSSAPGHYTNGVPNKEDTFASHINNEEDVFGDDRSATMGGDASDRAGEEARNSRAGSDIEKQNSGAPVPS